MESRVGKGKYLERIRYHGRGRFGVMHHPSSHVKIKVGEEQIVEDAGRAARRNIRGWKRLFIPLVEDKPIVNKRYYYNW